MASEALHKALDLLMLECGAAIWEARPEDLILSDVKKLVNESPSVKRLKEELLALLTPNDNRPHRRFQVNLKIEGDRWVDVLHQLNFLVPHLEEHGPVCSSVAGGAVASHIVTVTEDKEMTPEKYEAALMAYVDNSPKKA